MNMHGGDAINEAPGYDYWNDCINYEIGYELHQSAMILPHPDRPHIYALFHLAVATDDDEDKELRYTEIDMQADGGLGAVTEKNTVLYADTLNDMLNAVRHANGRDWWLVLSRYNSPDRLVFLWSPAGLTGPSVQSIGAPFRAGTSLGQGCFSPDGRRFASIDPREGLQLFDFDRCEGRLFHFRQFRFPEDSSFAGGLAFASKSRYLYVSTCHRKHPTSFLYQFDLNAEDIEASRDLIGYYGDPDELHHPLYRQFFHMLLGPDKKIYISSPNGTKYIHVINAPDTAGIYCDVEMNIPLPTYKSFPMPNIPYFRLFDEPGTVCDSLGINGVNPKTDTGRPPEPPPPCGIGLRVYPNPAIETTWVETPGCAKAFVEVYDISGRLLRTVTLPAGIDGTHRTAIYTADLPAGLYLLRVQLRNGEILTHKLAVMR